MIATVRNIQTALAPIPLLRYRFGANANVALHFHETDNRSLFFYPVTLRYRDGQWVFVEFHVAGSVVPCVARGRLPARETPSFVGSWIEFASPGLPEVMKNLSLTRRAGERVPVDLLVMINARGGRMVCRVSDVSATGMRLSGLPCAMNIGEELSVELVGMPRAQFSLGTARVAWASTREAGLHLNDTKGIAVLTSIVEHAIAAGTTAMDYVHPESCTCKKGVRPLEPSLPTNPRKSPRSATRTSDQDDGTGDRRNS